MNIRFHVKLLSMIVSLAGLSAMLIQPSFAQDVGTGPAFNNPRGTGQNALGDLIVADFGTGDIIRVDTATGDRTLVSDASDPAQGPLLVQPAGTVVLPNDRIFVTDLSLGAVFEIDPYNGQRTLVAGGDGTILAPFGLTAGFVRGRMQLIVADTGSADGVEVGPVLVDPDSGAITRIPVPDDGAILYNDSRSVSYLTPNGRGNSRGNGTILVGNFNEGSVISVHPVSGRRAIVSQNITDDDPGVGAGPNFVSITDSSISADGESLIVVDLGTDSIVDVNLKNGDRTVISSFPEPNVPPPGGDGGDFASPHGIEIVDGTIFVMDFGIPGVLALDGDGNTSPFSTTPVDGFVGIRAFDFNSNGQIIAADFAASRLFLVDPVSGERTILTGLDSLTGITTGDGIALNGPVAAIELPDGRIASGQFQGDFGIYAVDPATGDRSLLSGSSVDGSPSVGTGPELAVRAIILSPDGQSIYATSFNLDAVMSVDIATGNRTIISSAGTPEEPAVVGTGPAFTSPLGIDIAEDGTIFVSDLATDGGAAFMVDPVTGDRTLITGETTVGSGVDINPFGIGVFEGLEGVPGQRVLLADGNGLIEVDINTGERTLISAGGPLFQVQPRDDNSLFISNFGEVQGLEIVNLPAGDREVLSNAFFPLPE